MSGPAVKIQHGEIVRKVTLPESLEWSGVSSVVRDRFQLGQEIKFLLTYKDQDGDRIAVSSDSELSEMISSSGPPYRLSIKLLGQTAPDDPTISGPTTVDSKRSNKVKPVQATSVRSWTSDEDEMPALVAADAGDNDDDDVPELEATPTEPDRESMPDLEQVAAPSNLGTIDDDRMPVLVRVESSPELAGSAVWSVISGDKTGSSSSSSASTAQGLDEIAAEAEMYVDDALAEASPFDDPSEEEISPDDAPPVHSTSFADPDDDTGAPTPSVTDRSTDSPLPGSFPLPPSIATFLSGLPQRADSLSSHLTGLLSEGNTAPLRSLFTTAPQSVEDLPVLARTFAGELNNLLGSALSGVRDEANQLRDEFEALKVNIAKDKKDLEDRLRREWDEAVANEKARRGQGEEKREEQTQASEKTEEQEQEAAEEQVEDVAEAAAEAAELVNEKGLPMDPASRAARKQQRHEARLARKALRQAEKREVKRAARAAKAASVAESASISAAPLIETPATAPSNPFDDFTAELAPSEISEVASTLTRVSTPRSLIGAYPVLPSFPTGPAAPLAPAQPSYPGSDDFFHRRVSGSRMSMPGSFNPSTSASTQPAVDRNASSGYFVGNSVLSRSNTMPAPATAPAMPGAFASGSAEAGFDSLFAGFVNRASTPTAAAGNGGWAEVTPEQVKEAVGRLGFDLKDLGVRIAAERAWEEKRGKTLSEIVAHCVDKLV